MDMDKKKKGNQPRNAYENAIREENSQLNLHVCVGIFPLFANTPSHLSWRPFVCQKTPAPGPSGALNHKHLVSATTRHFERDIDACFCAGLPVNENENPNQRPKTVSVSQGSKNKGTPGRKVGFSMWMWMRMWSWSW